MLSEIKKLRWKQNLTQEDLAVAVGVTATTIGKWERGQKKPTFKHLVKLAWALGTSVPTLEGKGQ